MRYALLLKPHANVRYRQSLQKLAKIELECMLSAWGMENVTAEWTELSGEPFLVFETNEMTKEAWHEISRHSSICLAAQVLEGGALLPGEADAFGNPQEVAAARFIDENTPADAVVLTGDQHNNAAAALAGRHIVCGSASYLFYHGVDYNRQRRNERDMLERPGESAALFEAYGVDYVYISSHERAAFAVDEDWFREHCALVFQSFDVSLYRYGDAADCGLP